MNKYLKENSGVKSEISPADGKPKLYEGAVKLTVRQNMIMYCLQNGWELITGEGPVICCNSKGQFEFTWSMLMKLVNKGLIKQYPAFPFDYRITDLGKGIKVKEVPLDDWI